MGAFRPDHEASLLRPERSGRFGRRLLECCRSPRRLPFRSALPGAEYCCCGAPRCGRERPMRRSSGRLSWPSLRQPSRDAEPRNSSRRCVIGAASNIRPPFDNPGMSIRHPRSDREQDRQHARYREPGGYGDRRPSCFPSHPLVQGDVLRIGDALVVYSRSTGAEEDEPKAVRRQSSRA